MGFSGTTCVKMPIDWINDKSVTLSIGCQKTTQITDVVSSGMMLDYAWGGWVDAVHDCYIDPKNDKHSAMYEMKQFRKKPFEQKLLAECKGKTSCQVEFPFETFAVSPPEAQKLNMVLFAQVSCTQLSEENLEIKNQWGLAVACIGLFMGIFFASSVRLMMALDQINDTYTDMMLVTVDDYTAQCKLDKKVFKNFIERRGSFGAEEIPIVEFKKELI